MSEMVQKIFDDISPTYDRLNHLLSFNIDKSWRVKTIKKIKKRPNEKFLVLDLCAGTHDLGITCLKRFPRAHVIGADFSLEMLKSGQSKITKLGLQNQIQPLCADALNLPLKDNSVDVVTCAYGVRNFDDAQKGMQEIFRVLKPGGQVLVLEFFKPTKKLSRLFNKTYGEHVLPRVGKWISGHDSAYTYLRESIRGFQTTGEFEKLLSGIGYEDTEVTDFLFSISSTVSAIKPKTH